MKEYQEILSNTKDDWYTSDQNAWSLMSKYFIYWAGINIKNINRKSTPREASESIKKGKGTKRKLGLYNIVER